MTFTEISAPTRPPGQDLTVRASVILSVIALLLGGWAFLQSWDEDSRVRDLEEKVACLELPGANDCGFDGR